MPLNSPVPGLWGCGEKTAATGSPRTWPRSRPSTPVVIFTHSPLWDYYPRWNFQVSDSKEIRKILSKFTAVTAFHGHVHHTVYNKIGNLTSIGTMSTSWPWPYPPIDAALPGVPAVPRRPGQHLRRHGQRVDRHRRGRQGLSCSTSRSPTRCPRA